MNKMENLAKAIINVMKAVKGIEKSMTVGTGQNSYKGVADQDVKSIIGEAMEKNGLCILPIGIESKIDVSRWEEMDNYSKTMKTKQSVFTDVTTKYLLLHESGESVEIMGYGQGVDSQDKGAGKATTYALKNTLLYLFLVPTGKIDDTDNHHSESIEINPQTKEENKPTLKAEKRNLPTLTPLAIKKAIERIEAGENGVIERLETACIITEEQMIELKKAKSKNGTINI